MPPSPRQQLIDIYGGGTVEEAEATPEFAALCKEHGDKGPFKATQLAIRTMRGKLSGLLDNQKTWRAQVKLGLDVLGGVRTREEERKTYEALLRAAYYPEWNDAQKDHFDWACTVIEGNADYFLSFTNRLKGGADANPVNDEHYHFIDRVLVDKDIAKDCDYSKNLLAEAVNRYLRKRANGFYYPEHESDNTIVLDKLRENCGRALTFVQLIQSEMFEDRGDNYCKTEYDLARQVSHRRVFFILVHPRDALTKMRHTVPAPYRDWHKFATQAMDAVHLTPTEVEDSKAIDANRAILRSKILDPIVQAIEDLFEKVPGD